MSMLATPTKHQIVEMFISICKTATWSVTFFVRYHNLGNAATWLTESILPFAIYYKIFVVKCKNNMIVHLRFFPGKANNKTFQKMQKTPFLSPFWPFWGKLKFCFYQVFFNWDSLNARLNSHHKEWSYKKKKHKKI